MRTQQPITRQDGKLAIHSLFRWQDDETHVLRWLIRSLKGQASSGVWRELANLFVHTMGRLESSRLFIPIPGTKPGHAEGFAHALAITQGGRLADRALIPARSPGRQKRLKRTDRMQIRFKNTQPCTKYTNAVIVDDVVTTGATARAAYLALGQPKGCEVWCLLDRRPR